jgi:DNA-binding NarL/FixJ family response regulator
VLGTGEAARAAAGDDRRRTAPRLLLIDDHTVLCEAFAQALRLSGFDQVRAANPTRLDDDELLRIAAEHRPDIVVLDLYLGGKRTGMPLISPLRSSGAEVVVLTASPEPRVHAAAMASGAAVVIEKSLGFTEVIEVIHAVAARRPPTLDEPDDLDRRTAALRRLSRRERQVLAGLVLGRSAKQVAAELGVGVPTVRSHIRSMFEKLDVNNQRAAIVLALNAGWNAGTMS